MKKLAILLALLLVPSVCWSDSEVTIGGKTGQAHIIQEDGTSLRPRAYLNFVGAGATCIDTGGKTQCTISGGGGSGDIERVGDCTSGECLVTGGNITTDTVNKVAITAPASTSTLTIADGKTLTATNTVNLNTMTDGKWCSYTAAGTALNCNQDAPAGSGDITRVGDCLDGDCLVTGGNITVDTINGSAPTPSDAQYVTLALDGDLSAERVLTAGEAIDLADGGANSTITVLAEDATSSNKGVASFSTRDSVITAGHFTSTKGDFYNGTFAESFDARITSNGAIVTLTVTNPSGGNLTTQFSSGNSVLVGGSAIALTAGTDAAPQTNYIYVLETDPGSLVKSTTGFPTSVEHIRVGFFFVQSAAGVQSDAGAYINQNWNDHLSNGNDQGHLAHLGEWVRQGRASGYFSGLGGDGDAGTYVIRTDLAPDTVYVATAAGTGYQFHRQVISAQDTSGGDDFHLVNSSVSAYETGSDLYNFLVDADGDSMSGNYYNLVLWIVTNKTGEYSPLMINLPTCSYNLQSSAEQDVSSCDVYEVPRQFAIDSSTALLIARLTMLHSLGTQDLELISTVDLRGTKPTIVTGGGGSGHDPVTLAGTPDYLTIAGQVITLNKLDISDDTNATGGVGIDITANDFTLDLTEATCGDNLTCPSASTINVDNPIVADLTGTSSSTYSDLIWTGHNNYPAACTNQFIRGLDDAVTCDTVVDADAANDLTINSTAQITTTAGIDIGTSQAIVGTTALTIGDGTQTVNINSSDWDIDATGIATGMGNITSNGTIEGATMTQGGQTMYDANDVPGGELGGTFASFTVDATHSGSAHHDSVTLAGENYLTLSGQQITSRKIILPEDTSGNYAASTGVDGNATTSDTVVVVDSTDATSFPAIFDSATGSLAVKTDGSLTYDSTNGNLASTTYNNITVTAPAASGTLTIADGKTLTVTNTANINTLTDEYICNYEATGTQINCDIDPASLGGAETNSLETVMTGVLQNEIAIGQSGGDVGGYYAISGDITMDDFGVVAIGADKVENSMMDWDNITYLDDAGSIDVAAYAAVGTFASGDTFVCLEAGVGIRECDYDDLPAGSGLWTDLAPNLEPNDDGDGIQLNDSTGLEYCIIHNDDTDLEIDCTTTAQVDIDVPITVGGTAQSSIIEGLVINDGGGADADDFLRVEVTGEDQHFVVDATNAYTRIGDYDTNYISISTAGAMTFAGTGDIDLPADSVDEADMSANSVDSDSYVDNSIDDAHMNTTWSIPLAVHSGKIAGGLITAGAQIDGGEDIWVALFDASSTESMLWQFRYPDYCGGTPVANLTYSMASGIANKVDLEVDIMAVADAQDPFTEAFDTTNEVTGGTTVPGTADQRDTVSITLSNNDSIAAGEMMVVRVNRDHDDADDTATGDLQLLEVEIECTR